MEPVTQDPRLFKGMGFSLEERQALGIHGLLPPRMKTMAEQVDNCLRNRELHLQGDPSGR